jgi:hypothetical protein
VAPKRSRGFVAYVSLCLSLLVGAAGAVLWLNTSLAEGSFEIRDLEIELANMEVRREVINEQLVQRSEPDALAAQAAELGMVESSATGYILLEDGTVLVPPTPAGQESNETAQDGAEDEG